MKQKTKLKQTEIGRIPEDWEVKKLNEVCEQIFSGGTPNTQIEKYWNGKLKWLSSGETRQTFIRDTERKITREGVDNSSTRLAKKEDVVVAGAGQGHTRGQPSVCLVDTYVNQSVVVLRSNRNKINPFFLFYNLLSRYNELRQLSDAHSSRGSLTTKLLAELLIKLPSLPKQEIMAKILLDLDFKIELNNKMNKTLEAIGQALFKKWFVDEWKDEWKIKALPEIAEVIDCLHTKKPEQEEGGKLLLQFYNIGKSGLLNLNEKYFISEEDYDIWTKNIEVRGGDILINNAGFSGNISQVPYNFKAGIGKNITAIRTTALSPFYLLLFLQSQLGNTEIEKNIDRGTIFDSLNVKGIRKIEVLIPDKNTLVEFDKRIKPMRKIMEKNFYENYSLEKIRDALLPKLMNGEIRAG